MCKWKVWDFTSFQPNRCFWSEAKGVFGDITSSKTAWGSRCLKPNLSAVGNAFKIQVSLLVWKVGTVLFLRLEVLVLFVTCLCLQTLCPYLSSVPAYHKRNWHGTKIPSSTKLINFKEVWESVFDTHTHTHTYIYIYLYIYIDIDIDR